ncbi:MAG: aminopeptidase [Acidobacteriota bacterium]
MNASHFDRYARLLVEHGTGLREGQPLYIHAEVAHRDLVHRIADAAYARGCSGVSLWLGDPVLEAKRIRNARLDLVEMSHARERLWYEEVVLTRGALLSIRGEENPRLMRDLAEDEPERHAVYTRSANRKAKVFLHHGVNRSLCPWVVAGAATPAWAKLVFPRLDADKAQEALWEKIFAFTYADREDAVDAAAEKDRRLHARRQLLDDLKIRQVHITGGGSDLVVGLSDRARWLGGSKETADGQVFNANVPSEENFTTPDRREAEGVLCATMPFRTKSGLLVEGLVMHFADGRLVEVEADRGADGFRRWIATDVGASYLGELALVGKDSPIARSGLFFEHTLFDENAWPHVALGQSYSTCLRGGENLSIQQLESLGANSSSIHTDIMFGSPDVSILATRSARGELPLIVDGAWVGPFADP